MNIVTPSEVPKEPFIAEIFTGPEVTRQPVAPTSRDFNVNIVGFGKGVRNKFHTHQSDQVLIVTEGTGIVATETEQHTVKEGDVILVSAGEKHWHGATQGSEFAHIALTRSGSKTVIVGE